MVPRGGERGAAALTRKGKEQSEDKAGFSPARLPPHAQLPSYLLAPQRKRQRGNRKKGSWEVLLPGHLLEAQYAWGQHNQVVKAPLERSLVPAEGQHGNHTAPADVFNARGEGLKGFL